MTTKEEIFNSKSKIIRIYQTPHKIHFQIRSKLDPNSYDKKNKCRWRIMFRDKEQNLIKTIDTTEKDVKLEKFNFAYAELYWISNKTITGLYVFENLFQRKFPNL